GGSGAVGFAGDLDLDYELSSLISGLLANKLGGVKNADGVAELAVPLKVSGSASAPRVFVDVKSLAKKQAIDQTSRILGRLLSGGKDAQPSGEPSEEQPDAPPEKPRLPFNLEGLFKKK